MTCHGNRSLILKVSTVCLVRLNRASVVTNVRGRVRVLVQWAREGERVRLLNYMYTFRVPTFLMGDEAHLVVLLRVYFFQ